MFYLSHQFKHIAIFVYVNREAYSAVREFIHLTIRQELSQEPTDIRCSGHSLGGALAVLCSIDIAIHTLPAVNKKIIEKNSEKNLGQVKKKGFGFGLSSLFKRSDVTGLYNDI